MEATEQFLQWVEESGNIVFFGGAGVSTESGIPDFRSVDGLYNQQYKYPPETILSHSFYRQNPEEFYRFYRNKMLCLDAQPNITHFKLAELEKAGKLRISMVCIRKPEVKTSWNCTEAYCAITANAVDSLSARKIFSTRKEFRSVLSVVVR